MYKQGPKTILIVDDETSNITLLRKILGEEGYKLFVAKNGEKALQQVTTHYPDLILLDIMMPEMDGYEVCRRLKANEKTKDIPIIFVTAKNQDTDETQGLELGAVDYITKPISPAIVKARVKTQLTILEQRRSLEFQNSELERLNREQQGFFQMAVHDLNNPLAVIMGNIPFIFDHRFTLEKQKGKLTTIQK